MAKTPTYHHGDLRQALIESGAQLIEMNGVTDISLREVAKLTGVSHTAPYRHFKDKHALLAGIAEVGFVKLASALRNATTENPDDPGIQLLEAGTAYIRLALQNRQMHHLMFGGMWQPCDVSERLMELSDSAFRALVEIISNGQKTGSFKSGDTTVLALTAWSLVHGYAMLASTGQLDHLVDSEKAILELAKTIELNLISGIGK